MNPLIGGVWYAASSKTPSTFSGSESLTARTVARPLSVRAIVAGATGPGGFSLASEDSRASPERLACALVDSGLPACFTPQPEDVVSRLTESLEAGDAVVFMSNSGFGGIQKLLLSALQEKHAPPSR